MLTSVSNVMVIREEEPLNLECPFRTLDGLITPINQFFVRTHFPMPVIDAIRRVLAVAGVFLLAAGSWSAHPRARDGDPGKGPDCPPGTFGAGSAWQSLPGVRGGMGR